MPARKPQTVRIGHLPIALLPGESAVRIAQITVEVTAQWMPMNIVEQFDCDSIVHARFKLERYERFFDHFVRSGIKAEDIRGAVATYQAAIRSAEKSLAIAREGLRRKPPARAPSQEMDEDFAAMPVSGRIQ